MFNKKVLLFLIVLLVGVVVWFTFTDKEIDNDKNTTIKSSIDDHNKTFYQHKEHTTVDVLYGTDRGINREASSSDRYTNERSGLKFGIAQVSVPKIHEFGKIEEPSFFESFLGEREKIGRHIVITKLDALKREEFREILRRKLINIEESDILVYVHGFNMSFSDALKQTAQIAYDLEFLGIPMTYSWPSDGVLGMTHYGRDSDSAQYTTNHFVTFLKELIEQKGEGNIHLLAHSMGSRVLSYALKEISNDYTSPQFKNVILAAPDIATDVFEEMYYPQMLKTTEKITLYASSQDSALSLSNTYHRGKRLGEGGEQISVFEDMVTIDATGVDTSLLGHSYFSEKEILVNDLRAVVKESLPPQKRSHLIEKLKRKILYWKFDIPEENLSDEWEDEDVEAL
jgi:esterase/lipase superfamily enzyme